MRSTLALPLVLLLSLTTSSLCAPIPVPVEQCSHYASCRPFLRSSRWSSKQLSKESSHLQEPHFPTHQLEFSKHSDTAEVSMLEHHLTTPKIVIQPEHPIKNPKLNAILKAAHKDKASSKKKLLELGHKPPTEAKPNHSPNLKDPEAVASILKKIQMVAATQGRKCGMMGATAETEHEHRDGKVTITYTYGYRYMRTDYTSVLVVSIVVIFLLAIVLVELLDKVIETSRALGLDEGATRLEVCACERHSVYPPYSYTPKVFRLMPAPPLRSARSQPQSAQEEKVEEKSQGLESELA